MNRLSQNWSLSLKALPPSSAVQCVRYFGHYLYSMRLMNNAEMLLMQAKAKSKCRFVYLVVLCRNGSAIRNLWPIETQQTI